MIRITLRPTDPEFTRFEGWQRRAGAARDRLIRAWEDAGRPSAWAHEVNEKLYREFREVFLYKVFHRKCAYCESKPAHTSHIDVEHYRPRGACAAGGDRGMHSGYFWLTYEWWNLLSACRDCNSWHTDPLTGIRNPGKLTAFPIQGTRVTTPSANPDRWQEELAGEDPLLLNPYVHDPVEHIDFDASTGVPLAKSPYGTATIEICNLKRMSLCEMRMEQILACKTIVARLIDVGLDDPQISADSIIPASTQYSLWCKLWIGKRLKAGCGVMEVQVAKAPAEHS